MSRLPTHQITVCTACRDKRHHAARPGQILIERLRAAMAANDTVGAHFAVAEVTCMAACSHPCAVAFHAEHKASYVFGDMHPEADIGDILAFAQQYAQLHDGWCASVDRPGKLRSNALARIPAMLSSTQKNKATP